MQTMIMIRKILFYSIAALLLTVPAYAGTCKEHVVLCGVEEIIAKKGFSKDEAADYRIKLWSATSRVVATVPPGTQGRLLRRARGHYKIRAPRDLGGAAGWVDGKNVKDTLWLDTKTLERCSP
ncbi:MAG: hypothetical protein ACE5EI_04675 [Thermodesulfobacteriota bacterium]